MTHVLAVDGNSLAHRAYHATAEERREGAFVTGGLVRMLASAWPEGPFDGVVVAFDDPEHNRRKDLYAGYKAHRDDKDPQLVEALDAVVDHLAEAGLPVHRCPGAEADDLLAAAAEDATGRGWRCDLLSSDRDLLALVSESVRLLRPRRSMRRLAAYEPAQVLAEFGVRPEQYVDFAALRGDSSDGLDGVGGIGPKTAARLVGDYGSVEGVYAALSQLPPRLEAALRADRDAVRRNLRLMAPLDEPTVDLRAAVDAPPEPDVFRPVLAGLDLPGAAEMLARAVTGPGRPPLPPPPEDGPTSDESSTPVPAGVAGDGSGPTITPRAPGPLPETVEQHALF